MVVVKDDDKRFSELFLKQAIYKKRINAVAKNPERVYTIKRIEAKYEAELGYGSWIGYWLKK